MGSITTNKKIMLNKLLTQLSTNEGSIKQNEDNSFTLDVPSVDSVTLQAAVDSYSIPSPEDNRSNLYNYMLGALNDLQTSITAMDTIASKTNANIGPADTKDIARAVRYQSQVLKKVIRISAQMYDGND